MPCWHIRSWDNDKDKENPITCIEYGYRDYFINMNTEQIVEVKEYENCTGVRNKEWLAFDRVIIDLMNSEKFMQMVVQEPQARPVGKPLALVDLGKEIRILLNFSVVTAKLGYNLAVLVQKNQRTNSQ